MGLDEIKRAVSQLSPEDLRAFNAWFEKFMAEKHMLAEGKLDGETTPGLGTFL